MEKEKANISRRDFLIIGLTTLLSLAFRNRSPELSYKLTKKYLSYEDDLGKYGAYVDRVLLVQEIILDYLKKFPLQVETRPSLLKYVKQKLGPSTGLLASESFTKALKTIDDLKNAFQVDGKSEDVQCISWARLATTLSDNPTATVGGEFMEEGAKKHLPDNFSQLPLDTTNPCRNKDYEVLRLSGSTPSWPDKIKTGDVFCNNQGKFGHIGVILAVLSNSKNEKLLIITNANVKENPGKPETILFDATEFAKKYGPLPTIGFLRSYKNMK